MLKRKFRNKNSHSLLQTSNRGSDALNPAANRSKSETETDELPKEITCVLSEDASIGDASRESFSLMKSLSQRIQSTPVNLPSSIDPFVEDENYDFGKKKLKCQSKTSSERSSDISAVEKNENFYFEQILKSCGASRLSDNLSYLMSEDQAIFSIKVNKELNQSDGNVARFLNSLKKEIEKPEGLQKMLAHTLTSEDCQIARGPVQESLMRMLLHVDCLRNQLIELLLQKVADIVLNNEENESAQMVSSVLRQMRFLNSINEIKMAHKLFEIIHVSSISVQREIIFMLPEILPESQMEEVSMQLVDMLKYEDDLTNVIVDSLTNLHLSKNVRSEIRKKIVSRLDKCPAEFLPSLVQFLLSKCDEEELEQVIHGLRENLPFTMKHTEIKGVKKNGEEEENDSYVKVTFDILKISALASKQMANVWIKIISAINSPNDFRCLDLMILVVLYDSLQGKKKHLLTLIRNKIKFLILTEIHVVGAFKTLRAVAADYFSPILEMASNLLKSVHPAIVNFGAILYKESFIHFHFYMKQNVVNEISVHVGTGSSDTVNAALRILKDLCENHKEILIEHTVSIMGLLVKIPDLDPSQIRLLVDVIADLVFAESEGTSSGWRDEFQIFIRKQLASSKIEICQKGIVAAIMFGKHAGKSYENSDCTQINELLVTAMGSSETCEMKRTFFNDEFASMIQETPLNQCFLRFWSEKIHEGIIKNLFAKNIDVVCEHFPMSLQFFLRERDDRKMVFPVVGFIVDSNSGKRLNHPVAVIPSALRLLRCCKKDFESIAPAFGASVIMPEATVWDRFHAFDENRMRIIMDCSFLCVNYLTESMNAFCVHDAMDEALIRLKQLIYVRKIIGRHVNLMHDYVPPSCQFYAPARKIVKNKVEKSSKKTGRKRKSEDGCSSSNDFFEKSQSDSIRVPAPENHLTESEEFLLAHDGYLRQLETDCLKLLKVNLKKKTFGMVEANRVENCWSSTFKEDLVLSTDEALFLLEDLIGKSKRILGKPERVFNLKSKPSFSSSAQETSPEKFISDARSVLPELMEKIEFWSSYCDELLKANEGMFDGPGLFSKESRDVKLAFAAGLKFAAEIICWKGFQKTSNKSLLRDVLLAISPKNEAQFSGNEESRVVSGSEIADAAAKYLATFAKSNLVLNGGISIVKAIQACFSYSTSAESSGTLVSDLCMEMLCRPWFTAVEGAPDRGSAYNRNIDFLIRAYFSTINNSLEAVKKMATTAREEIDRLSSRDSAMDTMKSICRINFPLLYRAMCEALVSASNSELAKSNSDQFRLRIWREIIEIQMIFVDIVKIATSRMNLAALLKHSQSVIQLFFNDGLPAFEIALKANSVDVLKILKSFQTVTRFLHSICCHSKITNDSLVASHVPAIRAQCERLTLEVKGMLISNKIPMECITIAILKNKDLEGNDIISQETEIEDRDDDSELPAEDRDSEESAAEDDSNEVAFD